MTGPTFKVATFVSIAALLAAYIYKQQTDDILKEHLQNVLTGLIKAERKVQLSEGPKVAIGLGACLDYFSKALGTFDVLGINPPTTPKHFNDIQNVDELSQVFTYFFQHGAAAE